MNETERKKRRKEMDENPEIKPGTVELDADEFAPEHTKVRITMWLDGDVLAEVRRRAGAEGEKYQTWINRKLRSTLTDSKVIVPIPADYLGEDYLKFVNELRGEVDQLKERLESVEEEQKKRA